MRRGDISPPRQVNPRVPPALEAIVMKAMALRPSDRYPSAQALAEDVERWLADEPVSGLARAALGAGAAVDAAAANARWPRSPRPCWLRPSGSPPCSSSRPAPTRSLKSANLDLAEANQRASDANRDLLLANTRERARFDLSLDAIKTFHGGVSEDLLLKEKQFDGLRTKLLRGATDFYQRLEDLLKGQADRRSRAALGPGIPRHRRADGQDRLAGRGAGRAQARAGAATGPGRARPTPTPRPSCEAGAEPDRRRRSAGGDRRVERGAGVLRSSARSPRAAWPHRSPTNVRYRAAVAKCLHGIARVQYHTGQAAIRSHRMNRRGPSARAGRRSTPASRNSRATSP